MSGAPPSGTSAPGTPPPGTGAPAAAPPVLEEPHVPAWRLFSTLGAGGALAGLLLVFVFQLTQPAIQAHKELMLQQAVNEVLGAPERYDTLYLVDGALTPELPDGVDERTLDRVYHGFAADGVPVGFAISASRPGFQDVIRLIFGYDAATGRLLGMRVLESKETPGLGDKIEKDAAFTGQFAGCEPPLVGVKGGAGSAPNEIDTITGATISSVTVLRAINDAVAHWRPALDAYAREHAR